MSHGSTDTFDFYDAGFEILVVSAFIPYLNGNVAEILEILRIWARFFSLVVHLKYGEGGIERKKKRIKRNLEENTYRWTLKPFLHFF